ncbi:MAG: winged helix DNA-binding protein [Ruminococcus sp.]|nr:winged helix DNA-binding protein [Ruminococcus sp.]
MNKKEKDYLIALGTQEKQFDALYRKAALTYGLSDCSMWVLYFLSLHGDMTQQEMTGLMMFPKQTINSAIGSLQKKGYVAFSSAKESYGRKRVSLTAEGKALVEKTVVKMMNAEEKALKAFGYEKTEQFIALYKEFYDALTNSFDEVLK